MAKSSIDSKGIIQILFGNNSITSMQSISELYHNSDDSGAKRVNMFIKTIHSKNCERKGHCERKGEETTPFSNEIEINKQNFEITQQYLTEVIETDDSIEYKDAVNSVAMLCKKKTGHGSTQSVREYLNMLTSREGPFVIVKNDEKKRIIVKRIGK